MNKATAQIINYLEKNFKIEKMGDLTTYINVYVKNKFAFDVEIEPGNYKIWIGRRFVFADDPEAYNKAIKLINKELSKTINDKTMLHTLNGVLSDPDLNILASMAN